MTRDDATKLLIEWRSDPCWELADTDAELTDAQREVLVAYAAAAEEEWAAEALVRDIDKRLEALVKKRKRLEGYLGVASAARRHARSTRTDAGVQFIESFPEVEVANAS